MPPAKDKEPNITLSRVALKRLRVKEEILDVALEILSAQGVDALTLAAVTDHLGLTKHAIYHYYRSKEELIRSLVLELLRLETEALTEAISTCSGTAPVLGTLIRAFVEYYRPRLNAFRLIYCRFQLADVKTLGFDKKTLQTDIHPLTNSLFEAASDALRRSGCTAPTEDLRKLAFGAWLSAIGLVDMLGIAEATDDPLRFSDEALLQTLADVFDTHAKRLGA